MGDRIYIFSNQSVPVEIIEINDTTGRSSIAIIIHCLIEDNRILLFAIATYI